MKFRYLGVAFAMLVGSLALVPSAASAGKPQAVDCDVLKSTLILIDEVAAEVFPDPLFKNWGQVVKEAQGDPEFFAFLSLIVSFFSEGQIELTDASSAVPTVAKCGLMSLQVHNVNNSGPPN